MGKIKGFLFAVRHREILMTDLGLTLVHTWYITVKASAFLWKAGAFTARRLYSEKPKRKVGGYCLFRCSLTAFSMSAL